MEQHSDTIVRAFSRQAESFNASPVANADEILDAILEHARPTVSERWLEAACGPGIVSRRLARAAGSVHGVDAAPAMIELARRQASAGGHTNVTFEVGDATATAFPTAHFDGAVTRFSVHHIAVPSRLFGELARVVAPGGTIAILDHLADTDAEARSWAQEIERLRDPSHWACLSAERLRELGRGAGLEPVAEKTFGFEFDFEDWMHRGTDDPAVHQLIDVGLAERSGGTDCFTVRSEGEHRTLRLQMWLGVWTR